MGVAQFVSQRAQPFHNGRTASKDLFEYALGVLKKKMAADFAANMRFDPADINKELVENVWLSDTLTNLLNVFGDELKLGEPAKKAAK